MLLSYVVMSSDSYKEMNDFLVTMYRKRGCLRFAPDRQVFIDMISGIYENPAGLSHSQSLGSWA